MILRKPRIEDYTVIHDCYSDWPLTDRGPVTLDRAIKWTRRWMFRTDEHCLIGEADGTPVGLVSYRLGGPTDFIDLTGMAVVDNLVVRPTERQKGYGNAIVKALRDKLVSEGIVIAEFEAMQGPIADQVERGKYQKLGEFQGQTGKLVRGQLTVDMEV